MGPSWRACVLAILALPLITLAQVGDTQTDLTTSPIKCRTWTIIFAVGTGGTGNFGSLAGPSIAAALQKSEGADNVALQGVEKEYYPAVDINNFSNMDHDTDTGGKRVAELVQIANTGCAKTKMVLMGYSQGAGVQHKATQALSPTLASWISSIVVFGDVYTGKSFGSVPASHIKSFCAPGDQWCDASFKSARADVQAKAHVSYDSFTDQAVHFILSAGAGSGNSSSTIGNGTATEGGIQQVGAGNRPISQLGSAIQTHSNKCTRKKKRSRRGRKKENGGSRHLAERAKGKTGG